ncbi:vitellogenin-like [Octopus sinensis]|uniref:Vitellogenin-like n=1 Tax=Octopus sinensis TaxID=2607531 RepID=A0A6P7TYT7_9MOLL|nr:vitellogenin-like [Octopus sinensis]
MQPAYFAFLAALVALGQAGPIQIRGGRDQTTCAKICTGNHKFNYKQGIAYKYEYAITSATLMKGASSDEPTISIRAKVEIEPVSKCDFIMRITEATLLKVKDASKSTRFQEELTAHSLRFAYQDGIIEAVCPASGESTWALNMKRGFLSGFQNSMDTLEAGTDVYETDVVGTCMTSYSLPEGKDKAGRITKEKDLLSCTNREHYNIAMQSVMYNSHSKVNSLPLLKGTYMCHQTVDPSSKILQESECKEEHVFRPFPMVTVEQ